MTDQPERAYTAEEFERELAVALGDRELGAVSFSVAVTALRIAAAVMRPGLIEDAAHKVTPHYATHAEVKLIADAIRAALTKETQP